MADDLDDLTTSSGRVKHKYNTRSKTATAGSPPTNKKRKVPPPHSMDELAQKDPALESLVDPTNEGGGGRLNPKKFRSYLNDLFPSTYMQQRVAEAESPEPNPAFEPYDDDDDDDDLSSSYAPHDASSSYGPDLANVLMRARRCLSRRAAPMQRFNIVLQVADDEDEEDDDDEDDEYDDEEYDEDEDDDEEDDEDEDEDDDGDEGETDLDNIAEKALRQEQQQQVGDRKANQRKYRNTLKFRKLLQDKQHQPSAANDLQYFCAQLTEGEQEAILKQATAVNSHNNVDKPYRLSLLEATGIPLNYKAVALRKINTLRSMGPNSGEYFKIQHWVDGFMRIPFGVYSSLPLSLAANGLDECHAFMAQAKKTLDKAVYGLNDAKLQIMQMVGQWLVNPSAIGSAIAIKGPMGTGKTTLVKEGISQILGRDFAFVALGGATDSAFLEGHSYTYEGSGWGHIVDILMRSKSMNPVIYFDELDKVSETAKGEEIIGILTHLTDTTQNSKFHDRYYAELEFDLSRCLFIFSYNDESKINPILRDRMYRILTKGYDQAEKITIALDFLLPKIREQVCFQAGDVLLAPETLDYIITHHTEKEDGVRNLKRCLEIIHTKLNLYRLMTPGSNLFQKDLQLVEVQFPVVVTPFMVDQLIKREPDSGGWRNMYL